MASWFFSSARSRSFGRADNESLRLRATTAAVAMKTAEMNSGSDPELFCERVGAHLELDDLRAAFLAALAMKERARAGGGPEAAAFPALLLVVDAAVEALWEDAHRIREVQGDELALYERIDRVAAVAHRDRDVLAEAEDALPVDPGRGAHFGAALEFHVAKLRAGERVEGPALGAMPAGRGGAVQHLALAAVEAAEVAARERDPEGAVGVDVAAARPVAGERDFVVLGERGEGRVRAGRDARDAARVARDGAPHAAVERAHGDRVEVDRDALVLLRLDCFVGVARSEEHPSELQSRL